MDVKTALKCYVKGIQAQPYEVGRHDCLTLIAGWLNFIEPGRVDLPAYATVEEVMAAAAARYDTKLARVMQMCWWEDVTFGMTLIQRLDDARPGDVALVKLDGVNLDGVQMESHQPLDYVTAIMAFTPRHAFVMTDGGLSQIAVTSIFRGKRPYGR
ncbi:MAG: hypothetical protein J4F41_00250 [Alphaproteobacteria bacterium]|nr:hypothetical protein [Alphaproteobacteria bacterium]